MITLAALTDRELDTAIWAKRQLLAVATGGTRDIEAELAALLREQERRAIEVDRRVDAARGK